MDKLTAIKIKHDDGTYSDEIPVSVLSKNVEWDSTHTLVDVLGSIDVVATGTIQDQISQLFNEKVSATQLQNYVASQLNTDVTNWLNTKVNPVGSAVVVDSSLTVSGAAADAKVTGDLKSVINSTVGEVMVDATHSYAGGSENWEFVRNVSAGTYAIKIYNNTDVSYEVAVKTDKWRVIKIITDNKWNIVEVPSNVDVTQPLMLTYRGNSAITTSVMVVKIDESLTGSGVVADLKSTINSTVGEVMVDATHSYAGSPETENWEFVRNVSAGTYAIKIYNNTDVPYEVSVLVVDQYRTKIITDNKWNIVEVPSGATGSLFLTYRGNSAITTSVVVIKIDESLLSEISKTIKGTELSYGNYLGTPTSYDYKFNTNFSACPCKKADASGKVISLRIKNYASGTVEIYVGEVDQLYLFVPRTSFTINVDEGEKVYDVSDRNIFINEGEQILIKFSGGKTAFADVPGEPEGDNSFYYNDHGNMQLKAFGAQKAAVFGFGYTVASSIINEQGAQIDDNTKSIDTLTENVNMLRANFNVVMDRQGNKYKMIVQNGAIALLAMNFHHVLCVGNSFTTHPTTTDTESDYRNNLWWGHWSMAASAKQTAWTTLLQTALRQKVNDAVVTPVFGRRYETSYNTYTLNNPGTFTYWDGTAWQSLSDNLSDFSDVDGIVFFLGDNYSGNDWYTLYSAMVEKFRTWFPNATIFCCSCAL